MPEKIIQNLIGNSRSEIEEDGAEIREEMACLKQQLEQLKAQFQNLGLSTHSQDTVFPGLEGNLNTNRDGNGHSTSTAAGEEFPALSSSNRPVPTQFTQLSSWRDKVLTPNPTVGMQLNFIPPVIENGSQIVQIESLDVVDLVQLWERAVVVYVVGGKVNVEVIRGFIRKHWSFVSMPTIHSHEDGYFVMRFSSDSECDEILKGGPYFLNRAPMIVKKWSSKFDFKEEILRVIPVWIRLPSLPLHCWGGRLSE